MKSLSKLFLASVLLGALQWAPALAQSFPQPGVISGFVPKQTFRAVSIGLVLPATPTDFFCIAGAASKTIKVNKFDISGTVTTAVNIPVVVIRRAALDTGGTAASTTANPANTIGKNVTTNGSPVATLIAYTANPSINDSSPTYLGVVTLPLAAATGSGNRIVLDFNDDELGLTQPPTMVNGQTTQQICLNGNSSAATLTGNLLNITIEWTEE